MAALAIASLPHLWQTFLQYPRFANKGALARMAHNDHNDAVPAQGEAHRSSGERAAWTSPRVIVSDLGDARGASIIPGADGASTTFAYTYGS